MRPYDGTRTISELEHVVIVKSLLGNYLFVLALPSTTKAEKCKIIFGFRSVQKGQPCYFVPSRFERPDVVHLNPEPVPP